MRAEHFVLQQQQNLWRRFGISRMHLSPHPTVRSKVVILLLLTCCLLLLPLWDSVIVLCFVVRYFMSLLVLQSSWWGRESWLLCFVCLPGVSWLLCSSSSPCHGFVCSLWLWYFLIILAYYYLYYFTIICMASHPITSQSLYLSLLKKLPAVISKILTIFKTIEHTLNPFLNSFFPSSIRAYNNPSYDFQNTLSGAGSLAFIVLRMSCYCNCSVILPHSAMGWSALCDCDISWFFSITLCCLFQVLTQSKCNGIPW